LAGDMMALKEMLNRLEGKAPLRVEATVEHDSDPDLPAILEAMGFPTPADSRGSTRSASCSARPGAHPDRPGRLYPPLHGDRTRGRLVHRPGRRPALARP
jgi:hypothetical protein